MILLTGANGFIGSNLRKMMEVTTTDFENADYCGDLSDPNFIDTLPTNVSTVIHLAALNSTKNFYSTPYSVIRSIVLPTMNLLDKYPHTHFVYAGSSEEYASSLKLGLCKLPSDELSPLSIEDITNPRWCYAAGKIAMESAVISRSIEHGSSWCSLRFHNIYGPGQKNHFIPEFVSRLRNGDGAVYGSGETRSFCYIDDAIDLISKCYNTKNQIINIGTPHETSIFHTASLICDIMGMDPKILSRAESLPGSVSRRLPDISKMLSIVGEFNFTPLRDGLEKTILGI